MNKYDKWLFVFLGVSYLIAVTYPCFLCYLILSILL